MKRGTIYSATDKALYDALNQATLTNADMRNLFLSHGMVIAKGTKRPELAQHFSRLIHGYDDFQALAKLFDTGKRRERLSSLRIQSSAQFSDFESAAHQVVQRLQAATDSASVRSLDDGSVEIKIRYRTFNFNKSEFKQIEIRNAVITLEQEGNAVTIRGPQNEKVDEICRDLISTVETFVSDPLEIDEISLELFPAPEHRTKFFITLIEKVAGYKKHTVTDVYVYKPKKSNKNSEDDAEDDEEETEDDSSESSDATLGIHISRASLKGEGVLESPEMRGLIDQGFYISKIIWQAKETGIDPDIFEFEAQFSEPESCTQFSYLPRGLYKYQGNQQHSKTKTQLSLDEDRQMSKVIESAARKSLQELQATIKRKSSAHDED